MGDVSVFFLSIVGLSCHCPLKLPSVGCGRCVAGLVLALCLLPNVSALAVVSVSALPVFLH